MRGFLTHRGMCVTAAALSVTIRSNPLGSGQLLRMPHDQIAPLLNKIIPELTPTALNPPEHHPEWGWIYENPALPPSHRDEPVSSGVRFPSLQQAKQTWLSPSE